MALTEEHTSIDAAASRGATGNPVFDYRAEFRVFAQRLQRALMLGGLLAGALSAAAFFFGRGGERFHIAAGIVAGASLLCFLAGAGWGGYWRGKLRDDFRREFGPKV